MVAMAGKNCVAIASDLRLGNQALTIATNFEKARRDFIYQYACYADLHIR